MGTLRVHRPSVDTGLSWEDSWREHSVETQLCVQRPWVSRQPAPRPPLKSPSWAFAPAHPCWVTCPGPGVSGVLGRAASLLPPDARDATSLGGRGLTGAATWSPDKDKAPSLSHVAGSLGHREDPHTSPESLRGASVADGSHPRHLQQNVPSPHTEALFPFNMNSQSPAPTNPLPVSGLACSGHFLTWTPLWGPLHLDLSLSTTSLRALHVLSVGAGVRTSVLFMAAWYSTVATGLITGPSFICGHRLSLPSGCCDISVSLSTFFLSGFCLFVCLF
ncbi:uncharacterized protein LOC114684142 [Peromyscus leucopus]|uniref:uncharacterized protein LOC114684142 n=1 Tax=Peromyscus leucopus TaxID=10041 RepID=UPI0010A1C641|nr:uncharacterized protein LOC114684142 [Peromyscus leucopus]